MYVLHVTKGSSRSNLKMCEISDKIRMCGQNEFVMNWRLATPHLSVRGLSRTEAYCVTKPSQKRWLFREQIRKNLQKTHQHDLLHNLVIT